MKDQIIQLLADLKSDTVKFSDVIAFIEQHYEHTPTAFKNGEAFNESTQNQGSAKVFSFAQMNELGEEDTLSLFAEHYATVKASPDGLDHQNIRQFMVNGWSGIAFERQALKKK
ncbi:HopJ type III effector protein [Pedobacter namyangjuensis]|uniref:HopJ type III effector protein n=1 Tax=Pedobacter namyangjuensis TaxID=600626 RepID=UPI000DE49CCE|nr:HopJ type III effector protein [Pedobacter namyangjuensis]